MTRSWLRVRQCRIFGAPVYVHWYVLVVAAILVVLALRNAILALTALASYLAIILVHETGHAAVARRLGYEVSAVRIGLVHGRCEYQHPDSLWDAALVSWGGVIAQLLVAALVFILASFLSDGAATYFGPVVIFLGYINIAVAFINLSPSAPFDGRLAWRMFPELVARIRGRLAVRRVIKRAARRR